MARLMGTEIFYDRDDLEWLFVAFVWEGTAELTIPLSALVCWRCNLSAST